MYLNRVPFQMKENCVFSMETIQNGGECSATTGAGLDFGQAMHDFQTMFPTLDSDVIEAVLRSNRGSVDPTVDQLLTMSNDCRVVTTDTWSPQSSCTEGLSVSSSSSAYFNDPMAYVLYQNTHNLGQ